MEYWLLIVVVTIYVGIMIAAVVDVWKDGKANKRK